MIDDHRPRSLRRRTAHAAALAVVLAVLALTGCSGSDEVAGSATVPGGESSSTGLSAALDLLPSSATTVEFSDEAAKLERWGLTRPIALDSDQFRNYLEKSQQVPVASNTLINRAAVMPQEYGWGWLDVDWVASARTDGGAPVTVLKLRPDLDMATVVTSLDEHYTRSGGADRPSYEHDLAKAGGVPPFLGQVVVLPDRHLVVAGADLTEALAVLDGSADSLADQARVAAIAADLGTPEFAMVQVGGAACVSALEAMKGSRLTPSEVEEFIRTSGLAELAPVSASAVITTGDTTGVVLSDYVDAATAAADLPRRQELLASGTSMTSRQPYAEVFGPAQVATADARLRYEFTALPRAVNLYQAVNTRDAPWAFC